MGLVKDQLVVLIDKNSNGIVDISIREIASKYCSFSPETADTIFFIFSHQKFFDEFNKELIETTGHGYD